MPPDMDDIFASMFGGSGGFGMHFEDGPFHSFDSAGPGPSRKPRRGMDTDVKYEISLEEVYRGKTVIMNLERDRVCGGCKGSGARNGVKPGNCKTCNGKGAVIQDRHVSVPALISSGDTSDKVSFTCLFSIAWTRLGWKGEGDVSRL